jgi:hypothetical protein
MTPKMYVWAKHNVMDRLVGLKVLRAARSHGSMFLMDLGEWREEIEATGKLRRYGSWCFMVEMSSWRLSERGDIICSSESGYEQIEAGLSKIAEQGVISARLRGQKFADIEIALEQGYELIILGSEPILLGSGWTIFSETKVMLSAEIDVSLQSESFESADDRVR